ncbi:hypothetical protein B0H19DRAFT_1175042 [Mycena capillaripes]|nr:hypothetical protein B0H19DRAFT_1175042 [Mycena capillaripes]
MQISSPRAPRSAHRSSSTRSSPRRERVRPFGGNHANQPNYEGSQLPAPQVPENLHDDRGTFNVDPTAAMLESGGETYQEPIAPAGRRNFVGGFVGGLRKAWRNRGPEESIAYPEPAVVHNEETQYEPVPPAEPEMRYAMPVPEASYASPLPGAGHAALSPGVHYATPAAQYTPRGPDAEYPTSPGRESHRRQESSSSTSDTIHGATTQEHYEGTTIVNHEPIVPASQIGSPQYVEPQPGPDYAKLSPPRSEASFNSYLTRIHRFFQTINDLPWIAPDRVTVDYIPGKAARQDEGLPLGGHLRSRPGRRHAVISWYNSNAPQPSIDLLSSGSGSGSGRGGFTSPLPEFPQAKEALSPEAQYADPKVYAPGGPGPMVMAPQPRGTLLASQPQPDRVRVSRVPVPQWSPEPADTDPYFPESPRYPNGGYVPYEQLDPTQMAQTYTGSSVGSIASGRPSVLRGPVSRQPI